MVVTGDGGLDDIGVEPVKGSAGVVDEEVNARGVGFFEEGSEGGDAGGGGNVEGVEVDSGETAGGGQGFGGEEGRISGGEVGDGGLAESGVPGGEVEEEGAGVERGGGVL